MEHATALLELVEPAFDRGLLEKYPASFAVPVIRVETETMEELAQSHRAAREQVFADLRLLLSPEQEGRWEEMERDLRRATTLGRFANVPRERLDVIDLVHACRFDATTLAGIQAELDAYSLHLDSLLRRRTECGERTDQFGMQFWGLADASTSEYQRARERTHEAALDTLRASYAIQEANDRVVQQLLALLPDSEAMRLRVEVGRATMMEPSAEGHDWQPPTFTHGCLQELDAMFAFARLHQEFPEVAAASTGLDGLLAADFVAPLSAAQRDSLRRIGDDFHSAYQRLRFEFGISADEPGSEQWQVRVITPNGRALLQRRNPPTWIVENPADGVRPEYAAFQDKVRELEADTQRKIRAELDVPQRVMYYITVTRN